MVNTNVTIMVSYKPLLRWNRPRLYLMLVTATTLLKAEVIQNNIEQMW